MFVIYVLIVVILYFLHFYYKNYVLPKRYFAKYSIPFYAGDNIFLYIYKKLFNTSIPFSQQCLQLHRVMPDRKWHGVVFLNKPAIFVRDPEMIGQITVKHFDSFTDHSTFFFRQDSDPFIAKMLVTLPGEKWHLMRSTLSPAFTSWKMRGMFILMSQYGQQMVNHYLTKYKENNIIGDGLMEVDCKTLAYRFANDVIANTAFGVDVNSFQDPDNIFFKMGKRLADLPLYRLWLLSLAPKLCQLINFSMIPHQTLQYFIKLINDNVTAREQNNITRPDMLQLLIAAKHGALNYEKEDEVTMQRKRAELTNMDIAAQAFIFFFAGYETTAATMGLLMCKLATNPDVQQKLYAEIKSVQESNEEGFTYEKILGMKYLDMVVSETLRLHNPAPVMDRLCTKTTTLRVDDEDVTFEKGMHVLISSIGISYDEQNFPNPTKFDPERFSAENKSHIKPYTYLPWGAGPRLCIGQRFALMEVKIFICYFLAAFEIVPIAKSQIPVQLERDTIQTRVESAIFGIKPR